MDANGYAVGTVKFRTKSAADRDVSRCYTLRYRFADLFVLLSAHAPLLIIAPQKFVEAMRQMMSSGAKTVDDEEEVRHICHS